MANFPDNNSENKEPKNSTNPKSNFNSSDNKGTQSTAPKKYDGSIDIPIDWMNPQEINPIVIFYGSKNSGKSTVIIRLIRYLIDHSIANNASAYKGFHNVEDYGKYVDQFKNDIARGNSNAPDSTANDGYLWIKIDGERSFSVLEAPGEDYFNSEKENANYPFYFETIRNNNHLRRIYVFILESGVNDMSGDSSEMEDHNNRSKYIRRIKEFAKHLPRHDKMVILFNKADKDGISEATLNRGEHNRENVVNLINHYYDNVLNDPVFSRKGFFGGISYKCGIVPFISGSFPVENTMEKPKKKYIQGSDYFPQILWEELKSLLRG